MAGRRRRQTTVPALVCADSYVLNLPALDERLAVKLKERGPKRPSTEACARVQHH